MTLFKSKKITGPGAESNQYRIKMDSIYVVRKDTAKWYELNLQALLPYIKKQKMLGDSVAHVVFNRKPSQDKYFGFFKDMIKMDNESFEFYTLLQHILLNKYSLEKVTALVKENTPDTFLNGISKDSYLASTDYKTWLLPIYIQYIKQLDKMKDSTLAKQPDDELTKINEVYHDKVKDYFLNWSINKTIGNTNSIETLNAAKKEITPYYNALKNEGYKKHLTKAFGEREKQLMLVQIGKSAPKFTLVSHTGKTYQLADFKGKLIYIDLWASWCVSCREEMPNFKKLYNKYKNNEQIAFMGIAVADGEKEWRKAITEDKPDWLQLYDQDGVVNRSYVANVIPKYILIDKNGNIINLDAPGPGKPEEIEKIIDQELAKKTL